MTKIFAARDATGEVRFVADVPRGAACACFCLACGSPLVARKGEINEWHFAHESDQERPECEAGLRNLLRRIVLDELRATDAWVRQPFTAPHPVPGRTPLSWSAQRKGEVTPLGGQGPMEPVAFVTLVEGAGAEIYIAIGNEHVADRPSEGAALLHVHCPLPELNTTAGVQAIRTEDDARAFVRKHMTLRWGYLPDFQGLYAEANREAQRLRDAQQRAAGAHWAQVRRSMQQPTLERLREDERRPPAAAAPAEPPTATARVGAPPWAPGILPGASVHYRELDDGSKWVCYRIEGGAWRLAPVPEPQDGWDETFPASIAVPEGDRWLRVVDQGKLLTLFNQHARVSLIDSDLAVIARAFRG